GAGRESDFHFIERDESEKIAATLVKLVKERIPPSCGFDPIRDVQVLCPMNRGTLGVRELNSALQQALNPVRAGEDVVERFGWRFPVLYKVMLSKNDYDKHVFTGDIGPIDRIAPAEHEVTIRFDERSVKYDFGEL